MNKDFVWQESGPGIWKTVSENATVQAVIEKSSGMPGYHTQLTTWAGRGTPFPSRLAAEEFITPFLAAELKSPAALARVSITYNHNPTGRKNIGNCGLRAPAIALNADYEELRGAAQRFIESHMVRRFEKDAEDGLSLGTLGKFYERLGLTPIVYLSRRGLRIDRLPRGQNFILNVNGLYHMTALLHGAINDSFPAHFTPCRRIRRTRFWWCVPEGYKFIPENF